MFRKVLINDAICNLNPVPIFNDQIRQRIQIAESRRIASKATSSTHFVPCVRLVKNYTRNLKETFQINHVRL